MDTRVPESTLILIAIVDAARPHIFNDEKELLKYIRISQNSDLFLFALSNADCGYGKLHVHLFLKDKLKWDFKGTYFSGVVFDFEWLLSLAR